MKRLLLLLVVALLPAHALAHKASDAYLTIERNGVTLTGRLDIALRDLEDAVGLDANGDGAVSWGELVVRREAVVAYALPRLRVAADGADCTLAATPGEGAVDTGDLEERAVRGEGVGGELARGGQSAERRGLDEAPGVEEVNDVVAAQLRDPGSPVCFATRAP